VLHTAKLCTFANTELILQAPWPPAPWPWLNPERRT